MGLMSIGEFAQRSRLSARALRLYDELGLLTPDRVDPSTGYRWYAPAQLRQARLVAAMRQIGMPLPAVKAIAALDPWTAAAHLTRYWAAAEAEHAARRSLTESLVARLTGKRPAMYEVTTRDVPERRLLCHQQHVTPDEVMSVGRSFLFRFSDEGLPRLDGVCGAPFVAYYGEVNADSDGPIEWCRPIAEAGAEAVAARFPDLTMRTEPAHEEAFVHLPSLRGGQTEVMAVIQALESWVAHEQRQPSAALRQIFIKFSADGPSCDFALPLTRVESSRPG